jgi:hypothetical protein
MSVSPRSETHSHSGHHHFHHEPPPHHLHNVVRRSRCNSFTGDLDELARAIAEAAANQEARIALSGDDDTELTAESAGILQNGTSAVDNSNGAELSSAPNSATAGLGLELSPQDSTPHKLVSPPGSPSRGTNSGRSTAKAPRPPLGRLNMSTINSSECSTGSAGYDHGLVSMVCLLSLLACCVCARAFSHAAVRWSFRMFSNPVPAALLLLRLTMSRWAVL